MFWDHDDDKLREECGVFGIYGHPEAAVLTTLGLHALQHRGQEACGITTYDGGRFYTEKGLGLVGDNFRGKDMPDRLPGFAAIGHNRYSTQGETALRNIQPLYSDLAIGGFALAHNGNLTNARKLRKGLEEDGAIFQSTMDTEVVMHLVARSGRQQITDRIISAMTLIEGGYAFVGLTNGKLIGARDPIGLRPLVLGQLNGAYVLTSETCALDLIGAQFIREIENGEIVIISDEGIESLTPFVARPARPCVFEYVYFSRPDSYLHGRSVYEVRRRMGRRLAEETLGDIEADVIVPVPDSGVPAAIGFSEVSNLPFQMGIIRSHYVGRTFIQPSPTGRKISVSKKHAPNRAVLEGKRVVLIDDSIVRGNTSEKIVQMVRDAGATEVHFRSASPPIKHPDFYGIDMPTEDELLASRFDLQQMTERLGADSLGFLSVEGLYQAIDGTPRDARNPAYADHCFTGDYPTTLTDHAMANSSKVQQLSLLDDA